MKHIERGDLKGEDVMTKKTLRRERNEARQIANTLYKYCVGLEKVNKALTEVVDFQQEKIGEAITYCERRLKRDPAWLREVYRNEL